MLGIGTDILKLSSLASSVQEETDPFVQATYTERERALIRSREVPLYSYGTRFAGKEAVFKCLGVDGNRIRLNEIEILERETGQPYVILHGRAAEAAAEHGIREIHISLSYEDEYAIAFAAAE